MSKQDSRYLIGLRVRGQTWVWVFDERQAMAAARSALRYALDPALDFSAGNAARIIELIKDRVNLPIPSAVVHEASPHINRSSLRHGAKDSPRGGQGDQTP